MVIAMLMASLFFIHRIKKQTVWRILAWESILAAVFPIQSTWWMLENNVSTYHFSSQALMFFVLGTVTKPWMIPVHMLVGCGLTTLVFFQTVGGTTKLLDASISAQVNALWAGIVSATIMTIIEGYHKKLMESKIALLKAEEERQKAIDHAISYEALKAREELIRRYVRPSLVDEIRAGMNPADFKPIISKLAIMFCDIRDFTQLTEVLNPYERQAFLNQYFTMMTHPIVQNGGEVDKIMGDCVMGVFPDGAKAVQASIGMRLELQKFNQNMFGKKQPLIRNGIGIAKGDVMQGNFGSFEKLDRTVIGEAVNIAARLEAKTKMYNLEVIVTEDVILDLPPDATHYRWIDLVQVKGSTRHLKLYEIYGHQPEEVRKFKDETRDLLEKALTIYFQKGFKDASRLFKAMLERVPPHRFIPNDLMDNLLRYYISHCDAWINDNAGTWEQIEKWEGVHIFYEK